MRKLLYIMVAAVGAAALIFAWNAFAQTSPRPLTGARDQKTPPAAPEQKPVPKEAPVYIEVPAWQLEQEPASLENHYVQLADTYGDKLDKFPPEFVRFGVTPDKYFGFFTHRVLGSNMICFVPRTNKDFQAIMGTLIPEIPIYLMGKVGPQVTVDGNKVTFFMVERMVRGNSPPGAATGQVKKPLSYTLEWDIVSPAGVTQTYKKLYTVPKPGRYPVKNPYTGKNFYMTFDW